VLIGNEFACRSFAFQQRFTTPFTRRKRFAVPIAGKYLPLTAAIGLFLS
jgi:hypothetical protein